ncbi:MAG: hypothetical protein HY553_16445 [Elusimicrobia bacterium]|nr:hypothetical protein [Elusimicrobiota bacterium]
MDAAPDPRPREALGSAAQPAPRQASRVSSGSLAAAAAAAALVCGLAVFGGRRGAPVAPASPAAPTAGLVPFAPKPVAKGCDCEGEQFANPDAPPSERWGVPDGWRQGYEVAPQPGPKPPPAKLRLLAFTDEKSFGTASPDQLPTAYCP